MRGLASLLFFLALPATAGVSVTFPGAQSGPDAGFTEAEGQRTRNEIARHLEALGRKYLPPGQELAIEVLAIDLGGRVRGGIPEVRVMRAGEWPRIRMRYELAIPGEALRREEELVSDPDYLRGPLNDLSALGREKRMLDEWFRARFGPEARRR
jgi:hypothetical protein